MAKPGIKSIISFGDSLTDAGNAALWDENYYDPDEGLLFFPSPPYYPGRATNGPTWIEIVASAYGYDASPSLDGGINFAFNGAESGTGLSDQDTPNFLTQIRMYQKAVADEVIEPAMPWQLFVIWVGVNDFQRILNTDQRLVTPEDIENSVGNIATGIVALHENFHARMFLVPNMPPVHLTPYGQSLPPEVQESLALLNAGFNAALEQALVRVENAYRKVTILRLDASGLTADLVADPEAYGLTNVTEPAFDASTGTVVDNPDEYLSWDGFHPTVAGHALFAQAAMDIIPIGSWWGHSVSRGPGGEAWLDGMGWVVDEHWPWVFSYSLNEGEWMWTYEEGGTPEGFFAYVPKGYKWIFSNAMSGWYYDYESASWKVLETVTP